jgi:hypothetical protein
VGGFRRRRGAHGAAGAATDLARTFIVVGAVGGDRGRTRRGDCRGGRAGRRSRGRGGGRGLGFGFTKALLGFEFGLALGFLFLAVTFFLCLAARLSGLALGLLDAFAARAALGFLFRQPAFLDIADLGVGQRARAGGAFVLGQRPQHHAGTGARCRRCRGTGGRRLGQDRRGLGRDRLGRMGISAGRIAANAGACHVFRPRPAWCGHG